MCGIFGYLGKNDAKSVCLNGLKKLEYRGYDSSGIAGIKEGQILCKKVAGKVLGLEEALKTLSFDVVGAIAHTRWATHGVASEKNAHPHMDEKKTVAVVHNGVIENYAVLKENLLKEGVVFDSDTDTEVIAQLIARKYQGNLLQASLEAFSLLEGSYAVGLIHKNHPNQMIATAQESPLVVAINLERSEAFIASDPNALTGQELDIYFLENDEIALLEKGQALQFFNKSGQSINKQPIRQKLSENAVSKGAFKHYMLKEIYEEPDAIRKALFDRFDDDLQTAYFKEFTFPVEVLEKIKNIIIIACGTSWHAAYIAAYWLEAVAQIPAKAEIASEFRYKHPVICPNTLIVVLSQSGETADTIAGLREAKRQGARNIALCNVPGSTIAREADATIFLHAGPELAVASTKTFFSQITILYLLTLLLARQRSMTKDAGRLFMNKLYEIPEQVQTILDQVEPIKALAKKYAHRENFFVLGRNILYPTALEAALKIKEIAYANATGYPAGEMKHGPIALLDSNFPVIVLAANDDLQKKIMSNLMESKARKAPIIAIAWKLFEKDLTGFADDILWIPKTSNELACFPVTTVCQLLTYYMALERGRDIDQPRNLAKSVTVE